MWIDAMWNGLNKVLEPNTIRRLSTIFHELFTVTFIDEMVSGIGAVFWTYFTFPGRDNTFYRVAQDQKGLFGNTALRNCKVWNVFPSTRKVL